MRRLLLVLVVVLLAPSSAYAYSISTVGGKEVRWNISDVGYYLGANGWSGITNGKDKTELNKSFSDWQSVTCSKLAFHQIGETNVTTVLPVGASANGKNELIWKEGYWPFGNYVLGVTSPMYSFTGTISEADIAFNGTISWNTNGSMWNSIDVKSVGIHEIGHFFGLQHNLSFNENDPPTMAPYADPYGKSASLHNDDKNGICFLYPKTSYSCTSDSQCPYVVEDNSEGEEYYASQYNCVSGGCQPETGSSNPGAGELGSYCGDDTDCQSQLFCVKTTEGNWCSQWCSVSGQNCPSGFACYVVEDDNDEGICVGGLKNKVFGEYCFADGDCKNPFFCLSWWNGPFCTKECSDVDGGSGCPTGYTCYPSEESPSGGGACFPGTAQKKENGKSCSFSSDCQSGMCFPNPGTSNKYCREKCAPASPVCSGSSKCIGMPGDITGTKGGCVPLSLLPEKAVGASCGGGWECISGFCYYDSEIGNSTCRQICDPDGAGSCPDGSSCMSVGAGQGACLPTPDPQPEGSWCQHHYECTTGYCVQLPGTDKKFCRNACTIGSGCKDGFACIFYETAELGACMPQGKDLGEICSSSTECTTQICWAQQGTAICLSACLEGSCTAGYSCHSFSPYGPVCMPEQGVYDTGVSCSTDTQCISGLCISNICRSACDVLASNCPVGEGCVPLADGTSGACVKSGSKEPGAGCSSDYECATMLCVELPDVGRVCAFPCGPVGDGSSCPPDMSCGEVSEISGFGACQAVVETGPEQDTLPDVTSTPDVSSTGPGGGRGSGMCSAFPGQPDSSIPALLLVLLMSVILLLYKRHEKIVE